MSGKPVKRTIIYCKNLEILQCLYSSTPVYAFKDWNNSIIVMISARKGNPINRRKLSYIYKHQLASACIHIIYYYSHLWTKHCYVTEKNNN